MLARALSRGLAARVLVAVAAKPHQPSITRLQTCGWPSLFIGSPSSGIQDAQRFWSWTGDDKKPTASGTADADKECFLELGLPEAVAQLLARTSTHGNVLLDPSALTAIKEALLLVSAERSRGDEYAAAASSIADSTHREVTAARGIQEQHANVIEEMQRATANLKEANTVMRALQKHHWIRAFLDHEEDRMLYGSGKEQAGRESAWHKRLVLWTRWVESNPDKAAVWAHTMEEPSTPQHIPEKIADIYESVRDYSGFAETLTAENWAHAVRPHSTED